MGLLWDTKSPARSFSRACVATYTHCVSSPRRVRHGGLGNTHDIHKLADVDVRSNKGGVKVGGVDDEVEVRTCIASGRPELTSKN